MTTHTRLAILRCAADAIKDLAADVGKDDSVPSGYVSSFMDCYFSLAQLIKEMEDINETDRP